MVLIDAIAVVPEPIKQSKIKSFLFTEYKLDIFSNINEFPIQLDKTTQEYYKKIAERIDIPLVGKTQKDRYYIQKIKPFFVKGNVYYEVTFTKSHDKVDKFDRIIAFTNLDTFSLLNERIDVLKCNSFIDL